MKKALLFSVSFVLALMLASTMSPTTFAQEIVKGAHEGMKPGEKTDDMGITVPVAPVDFPARRYPASEEFPTGPAVGEKLPEFQLPNQNGEMVDFHASRGDSKSIVVFYRSAVW
jgi:predicted homoserine dehydrogenase-like protein